MSDKAIPKIYLSGPISGMPGLNKDSFTDVRDELVRHGYSAGLIVVPHELFDGIDTENHAWEDYMRTCIAELLKCDIILTLEGWEKSKGAIMEVHIARQLNVPVRDARVFITEILKDKTNADTATPSAEQIAASTNA